MTTPTSTTHQYYLIESEDLNCQNDIKERYYIISSTPLCDPCDRSRIIIEGYLGYLLGSIHQIAHGAFDSVDEAIKAMYELAGDDGVCFVEPYRNGGEWDERLDDDYITYRHGAVPHLSSLGTRRLYPPTCRATAMKIQKSEVKDAEFISTSPADNTTDFRAPYL